MIVILGNGVAGNTAASTIRRLDSQAEITIVSEDTLSEYTACALPHYIAGDLKRRRLFLRTKKSYAEEGIKTIFGRKVTSIDLGSKKIFMDGRSLAYDKLVIATGSKPILIPIPGIDLEGVFTLKSPVDADRILESIGDTAVLIGSGPVGVETAIALRKRGSRVYLIEVLGRLMPRIFDETPASILGGILEGKGIKVLVGEKVTAITGNGRVTGVVTDKREVECNEVVLGTGMRPNIELAKQAGIRIGALGGISVNRRMMTSIEDIYACGDCVETEEMATGKPTLCLLWHNAKRQGEVAGYNCAGISKSYSGSENITSLDIAGIHIVSFGRIQAETGPEEDIEVIEKTAGNNYYRLVLSGGKLIGAQSVGDAKDMGTLLYALTKKDNLRDLRKAIDENNLPLSPWYYRAARFLAPASGD